MVYGIENKTFDFRNMRASDLPFNKRVHLPKPLDEDQSLAKKEERSALWKHCKEKHNSEMQKFEVNVTGRSKYISRILKLHFYFYILHFLKNVRRMWSRRHVLFCK